MSKLISWFHLQVTLPDHDSQNNSGLSRSNLKSFRASLTVKEIADIDGVLKDCGLPTCETFPLTSESFTKALELSWWRSDERGFFQNAPSLFCQKARTRNHQELIWNVFVERRRPAKLPKIVLMQKWSVQEAVKLIKRSCESAPKKFPTFKTCYYLQHRRPATEKPNKIIEL